MKPFYYIFILFLYANCINAQTNIGLSKSEEIKAYKAKSNVHGSVHKQNVAAPSNDYITNAISIDACGVAFNSNNRGATAAYSPTVADCGSADGTGGSYHDDVDCNNATDPGASGDGADVSYSVESDIWYKFCPSVNGTWSIKVTPSNCAQGTLGGFQISAFQGTPSNLSTRFFSKGGPTVGAAGYTSAQTNSIAVTDYTKGCVYIQIDGYAGDECDFAVVLTAPSGSCNLILPVKLIDFKAEKISNSGFISWTTASEENADRFELQRSTDGNTFTTINTQNAAGNSNTSLSYSYTDKTASENYYRLKQFDFNGNFAYSKIIHLNLSSARDIGVTFFPTVAGTYINYSLSSTNANDIISFEIIDQMGIVTKLFNIDPENASGQLSLDALSQGYYIIKAKQNGVVFNVSKFVKL